MKMRNSYWCRRHRRCLSMNAHALEYHVRKNATVMDKELLHIMPKAGHCLG